MCEEMVIAWRGNPEGVSREELLEIVAGALPALVGVPASGG
jgi:hypothetical protein